MIDNQEKETTGPSVLYLNNRKIQSAKNNETAVKAFEIFAEFLDSYQMQNTKEIFNSEAHYQRDNKVREELNSQYNEKDVPIGVQLLRKVKKNGLSKRKTEEKVEEVVKPKKSNLKNQIDDFKEKSAKLDRILEERNRREEMEKLQENPYQNSPQKANKDEIVFKNQKIKLVESKEFEKQDNNDPSRLFANEKLVSKIGENEPQKSANLTEKSLQQQEPNSSMKKSAKHTETDDLIEESMGYDISVHSKALEEFDYVESIENDY